MQATISPRYAVYPSINLSIPTGGNLQAVILLWHRLESSGVRTIGQLSDR